jgi:hypothetical protein
MFVNNLRCRFSFDEFTATQICATDFPLTNLQLHKSALTIYLLVGMAASTLRHCFGQPAEVCTSCTFDTVTLGFFSCHLDFFLFDFIFYVKKIIWPNPYHLNIFFKKKRCHLEMFLVQSHFFFTSLYIFFRLEK